MEFKTYWSCNNLRFTLCNMDYWKTANIPIILVCVIQTHWLCLSI